MLKRLLFLIFFLPTLLLADTPEQVDFLTGGVTDSSGDPLAAGKIYTYSAGTTSDKTTWQDAAKTTPHTNPIILDAEGKKLVFADGNYKFKIDDSDDATQYTLDGLKYGRYSGETTYAGASTGSSNSYTVTPPQPLLSDFGDGSRITFEANHTNTGAATLNVSTLGAIDLNNSDDTALGASEIISGNTYTAVYESSTNAWLLQSVSTPTWTNWTPTLSAAGAMTYTSTTITKARYYRVGKLVFYAISITGTVGGTPNTYLSFTLPIATVSGYQNPAGIFVVDGGATPNTVSGWNNYGSTTRVDVYRYDKASYTAGVAGYHLNGFYEVP